MIVDAFPWRSSISPSDQTAVVVHSGKSKSSNITRDDFAFYQNILKILPSDLAILVRSINLGVKVNNVVTMASKPDDQELMQKKLFHNL